MMTMIQEEQLNVKHSCALFEISESSYYDWKKRKPSKQDGWCYLSTIMDRYTKKILAWNLGKRMTEDLVIKTFNKVIAQQELPSEVILHSDQGSQYTSKAYEALLKAHQVKHSFSRKGYPYHHASLESWHGHRYLSPDEFEKQIA